MPHKRNLKYKLYKQLQSDICGTLLLKIKLDRMTFIILDHFQYNLKRYKKFSRR